MSDLGALLRKAREQRGYTLEDIQEYTKIRKRYLEAIESGDYKVLPGSFYVRAFVKTYAETVGLDAEEVLRLYHKELPQTSSSESVLAEPARIKAGRRSHQHNDRLGKMAVSLLMWAFPILIVVVIYIYYSNNKDPNTNELNSNPPITTQTGSESPSETISETPSPTGSTTPTPSETVTLTLKETRNSINYYEVSPVIGHKLRLEVADDCWVEVRANNNKGEKLFYNVVKEPITLIYNVTTPLYVNVGRSDFVEIYIDDVMVDDGNKPGTTKYIFTPVTETVQ
jgi:transcriptional regulator with XRE-family HTH domain